jgi:GGDEF domain-containing protein
MKSEMEGTDRTVTNLRRYFLWCALYLALIFGLGQADYLGRPLIHFASYFYLLAMIGVPATLFFPHVTRVSAAVPIGIWGMVYAILSFVINRGHTSTAGDFAVIVLEFLLLELGVWLAYRLAEQIAHAESVIDELALDAFPHRAQELDEGSHRVRTEFNRSRRYHRPLSLLILEVDPQSYNSNGEVLKAIQYDIVNRFTVARVGQIIDDRLRQTDLVLRDRRWSYVIICPETDLSAALLLAQRITETVREKTGLTIQWGAAAFPEEALTFDDLLKKARQRLTTGELRMGLQTAENAEKEISNV